MCYFDQLEVRRWKGDEWPEKRYSIGKKHGNKEAVAISPRYGKDEDTIAYFKLFSKAPELHDALEHVLELWLSDADPKELEQTIGGVRTLLKESENKI